MLISAGCGNRQPATPPSGADTLRIGVARLGSSSALVGLRPVVQNLSIEGLARISENGRPEPALAQQWTIASNGLSMDLQLRPNVTFHDGSAVSSTIVADILNRTLPAWMGPAFQDVEKIRPTSADHIEIRFKRVSPFLLEALEAPIRQPGHPQIGTGPFFPNPSDSLGELHANTNYYLGAPKIDRVVLANYPNVRAAWADLLRNKVDMLYEVSVDALDSIQGAKNISVYSQTRNYQLLVVLNVHSQTLRTPAVRRALNLAVDRDALIRDAFNGHALASSGPIWPRHWAVSDPLAKITTDLPAAEATFKPLRSKQRDHDFTFTCLVPPDYEHIALVLKRQLEAVGVDMNLRPVSPDQAVEALSSDDFEAVLVDAVSAPSLFRSYQLWHSGGALHFAGLGSVDLDRAFDAIQHATSDDEYRSAVAAFQKFVLNDPPAIFLAWGERARAVSNRFSVTAERGRDVLTTLRLWQPSSDEKLASRN